jgi:hypothetical protein
MTERLLTSGPLVSIVRYCALVLPLCRKVEISGAIGDEVSSANSIGILRK